MKIILNIVFIIFVFRSPLPHPLIFFFLRVFKNWGLKFTEK